MRTSLSPHPARISDVLNREEFIQAMEHFTECQQMVLKERTEQARLGIQKWIDEAVILKSPVYSLRPDAVKERIESIFTSEDVREFVFDLGFLFFTTWGVPNAPWRLSANLVEGLSMDGFDAATSSIPDPVLASMPLSVFPQLVEPLPWWKRLLGLKPQTLQMFLANNKTLLVAYMVYLTNTNDAEASAA